MNGVTTVANEQMEQLGADHNARRKAEMINKARVEFKDAEVARWLGERAPYGESLGLVAKERLTRLRTLLEQAMENLSSFTPYEARTIYTAVTSEFIDANSWRFLPEWVDILAQREGGNSVRLRHLGLAERLAVIDGVERAQVILAETAGSGVTVEDAMRQVGFRITG